ncbi:MAG: hypothetical protein FJ197_07835 [Gammaproteobacteria bacterium]|nr:hypothetical protein [Gammaproteobacteria bacterium]
MQAVKVIAIVALALGPTAGAQAPPAPESEAKAPPQVEEVSRDELEEELRRVQEELEGKPPDPGKGEFRSTKPLPADIAIALPSDI